ncbi:MAG: hypothetical protein LH470_10180 [Lysobacter sp.]|nr:hypothetical protein [Lysobacter sp.]
MPIPSPNLCSLARRHWRLRAAIVAAFCAALSGQAWADQTLDAMGGPGGGAFTARCPDGELLAGFELRAADDVDAIRPLCVTAYGPNSTSAASDSAWHGGDGGSPTYVTCPPRTSPIVTGMYVNFEGARTVIINSIHLFCDVAGDAQLASPYTAAFFDGPAWSDDDGFFAGDPNFHGGTQRCPPGQVAVGMHGRSGVWVDAIGLICGESRLVTAVKSIGRVGTGTPPPPRPPGWTICDSARDARERNSPAAPNLEAQCAASKTPVKSIGRVGKPTPDTGGVPMSLCDRARDARQRNSPAAPNLEAQCLASGGKL